MNILVDYNQLENEVLKDSISDFLSEMRENLPEVFNSLEMKTVLHGNYAEVYSQLCSQAMIEELTDDLARKLGCHVLYAVKEGEGKDYKVVAYSMPVENRMYIIYISSWQYGVVDSMTVHFYDSMENMYRQITKEYTSAPKQCFILEKEKFSEVLRNFY